MERKFNHIPGFLQALIVLEACVRHASFTKAGRELSLAQPTVSKHIAGLEERLDTPLFIRNNNRIRPTNSARKLANAIALGFGHAETIWEEIVTQPRQDALVIACSFGFAEHWMMPRFDALQAHMSPVPVRITASDWTDYLDLSQIDLAIVHELHDGPDWETIPLFSEEAFPVCSPGYLETHPEILNDPAQIAHADLLHYDVGESGFLTWREWLGAFDIKAPIHTDSVPYNAYPFITRAAVSGAGIALSWAYLDDQFIREGKLVKVGPSLKNKRIAYYAQFKKSGGKQKLREKALDWLVAALQSSA